MTRPGRPPRPGARMSASTERHRPPGQGRRARRRSRAARHRSRALRRLDRRLTAVVTVADDGGSSGRLRRELGVLPPGDLRMALAALAADDELGPACGATLAAAPLRRRRRAGRPRGRQPAHRRADRELGDPVPRWTRSAGLLGARGPGAADGTEPAGHRRRGDRPRRRRPGARAPHPRPGRGRVHARPGRSGVRSCPTGRRACPEARGRGRAGRLVVLGPGPGSPACCRTCWCPSCATRCRHRGPAGRRAQPGAAAGGDGRLLAGAAPGRALRARPGLRVDAVLADADAGARRRSAASAATACRARARGCASGPGRAAATAPRGTTRRRWPRRSGRAESGRLSRAAAEVGPTEDRERGCAMAMTAAVKDELSRLA